MNDYYAILGVDKSATPEEIKRAYRRACRESHPDVAGSTPEVEERFKQINAAYEVLSDPQKREMFDMGVDPMAPGGGGGNGSGFGFGGGTGSGFGSFADIFETFFAAAAGAQASRGPVSRQQRGRDQLERLTVDLADVVFGAQADLTFSTFVACDLCGGSCCAPGTEPVRCQACGGRGATERVVRSMLGNMRTVDACRTCQGFGTVIPTPCPECAGQGRIRGSKQVTVTVPAGADSGNRLRVQGRGEAGLAGGPNGDLYIVFQVRRHPDFTREGDNLVCTLPVPMTAAALGATMVIETLDGPQEVNVRPGSQPREVVTLEGLGAGRLNSNRRGDLKVVLDIRVPTDLDDAQRELLQRLAAERGEEHPEAALASTAGSVFSRLKDKLAGR
ncbi:MAG: DnaJ domain-containing protein [Bifidobacteriaceae bacterium]|nr:DnaJ domain-containing protein [Bifidobacteriaceae bacterium]